MAKTKTELFADIDAKVGTGQQTTGPEMNQILKDHYESIEAVTVKNTGNETVEGVKTFSLSPVIPAPEADLQPTTKKYVDDKIVTIESDLNINVANGGRNVFKDGVFVSSDSFSISSLSDQYISATPSPVLVDIETPISKRAVLFSPSSDTASFYYHIKKASYISDERGNIQSGESFRVACLFKAENFNVNSNILLRPETSLGSGVYVSKVLSEDWQVIISNAFIMPSEPNSATLRLYFSNLGVTSGLNIYLTGFTMIKEDHYNGGLDYNMEWLISHYALKNWNNQYGNTYLKTNDLGLKIASHFGKNIVTDPFFTKRLSDNEYEDWVVTDNVSIVKDENIYSDNILKVIPTAETEQLILRILPASYQRGFGKIKLNDYVRGCVAIYCSHTISDAYIGLKLANATTAGGYLGVINIIEGWQMLEHPALQVTDFSKNIVVIVYAWGMSPLPENFYFGLTGITVSKESNYIGIDENISTYIGRYSHSSNNYENIILTTYGDSLTAGNQWQPYLVDTFRFIHNNRGIGGSQVRNNATALAFVLLADGSFVSNISRNGGSTINSLITNDATVGSNSIEVANGSLFSAGNKILISSLSSVLQYETKTIVSIVENIITIDVPLSNTYTTSDVAMIEQFPAESNLINTAMCLQERIDCIPQDTQLLLILAGANDVINDDIGTVTDEPAENTTFYAAYKLMLNRIMTRLPLSRIFVIGLPYHAVNDSIDDITLDYQKKRDVSKDLAYRYGFPYLDLRAECGWNANNHTLYLEGNVHFNNNGSKRVAEIIQGYLKKYVFVTN